MQLFLLCLLLQVVDEWPAHEPQGESQRSSRRSDTESENDDPSFVVGGVDEMTYFKLLRMPGQPSLPPLRVSSSASFDQGM